MASINRRAEYGLRRKDGSPISVRLSTRQVSRAPSVKITGTGRANRKAVSPFSSPIGASLMDAIAKALP